MGNVLDTVREKQLNIRLSEEESTRLERVAEHFGLNAAGVIRMLLKRADDEIMKGEAARDLEKVSSVPHALQILVAYKQQRGPLGAKQALERAGLYTKQTARELSAAVMQLESLKFIEESSDPKDPKGYVITAKGRAVV